jgi:AraC-like DNA-binding protein/quercetin dioxygenase-like cupin family protein
MPKMRQSEFNGHGRGQIRVLAWDYSSGEKLEPHHHGWHQFIYAASGVMTVETPAGTWIAPTNRAVWVPARMTHAIEMSGAVAMRALYFAPGLRRVFPEQCRVVSVSPLLREVVLHVVERGGLDRRSAAGRHLLEVVLDLVTVLPPDPLRIDHVTDPRAERVARLVIAEPGDRATLAQLAQRIGTAKRTIERAFVRETGMSFGRWRQRVRMIHALRLLAAGQPVTTVALEVGYDSVSAFISRFRSEFGTTPGQYVATRAGPLQRGSA